MYTEVCKLVVHRKRQILNWVRLSESKANSLHSQLSFAYCTRKLNQPVTTSSGKGNLIIENPRILCFKEISNLGYNKSDITCLKTSREILYNTHNSAQAKLTAAVELQIIVTMLQ